MIVRCGVVKPDEPAITCDVRVDQRHHYHTAGTDRVWLNDVEDGFVAVQRAGPAEARDRGLAGIAAKVPPERRVAAMPVRAPDPPYQAHSPTSQAAAEAVADAGTKRQMVLDLLAAGDGLTDEECQLALSMNPSTQRPRRVELVEMGLVRDSGRTRPTHSGREAVVWAVATEPVPVEPVLAAPDWWDDLFTEQVARLVFRHLPFTEEDVLTVVSAAADMLLLHPDSDEAQAVNQRAGELLASLEAQGVTKRTGRSVRGHRSTDLIEWTGA